MDPWGTTCWSCVRVPFDMAKVVLSSTLAFLAGGAVIISLLGGEEFDVALVPAFVVAVWKTKAAVEELIGDARASEACDPCPDNRRSMKADIKRATDDWHKVKELLKEAKELAEKAKKIIKWTPEP